ncbi:MAG: DUF3037 domain-containing protein [Bacteroidia bacterium]|nr:DUF3037 domain-containing protein [Bacteroidia bacterium]
MQEKYLYEYAVIRIVPKVEREEFINVGIVLFSKKSDYLKSKCNLDVAKLQCFANELDIEQVQNYLHAFEKINNGDETGGPIAKMDVPSRFRWLTAVRSSVLQTSRPHPGFSNDLDATLHRLFDELVV